MLYEDVIEKLRSLANPKAVEGMARYGINPKGTLGVSVKNLRKLAKEIGKDHELALRLWASGIHEARILASMVDNPKEVTEKQIEGWVSDLDSWDTCDQACMNLFEKLPNAYEKAVGMGEKTEGIRQKGWICADGLPGVARQSHTQREVPGFPAGDQGWGL